MADPENDMYWEIQILGPKPNSHPQLRSLNMAWHGLARFDLMPKCCSKQRFPFCLVPARCVLMFSTVCARQKKVDKVEGGFKRHICRPLVPLLSHEPGKQCLKNNKHKLCHSFGKFCPFMSQQDHVVATPTSYPCPRPKIRSPRHPCLLAAFQ